jgi:hypothetical protein
MPWAPRICAGVASWLYTHRSRLPVSRSLAGIAESSTPWSDRGTTRCAVLCAFVGTRFVRTSEPKCRPESFTLRRMKIGMLRFAIVLADQECCRIHSRGCPHNPMLAACRSRMEEGFLDGKARRIRATGSPVVRSSRNRLGDTVQTDCDGRSEEGFFTKR